MTMLNPYALTLVVITLATAWNARMLIQMAQTDPCLVPPDDLNQPASRCTITKLRWTSIHRSPSPLARQMQAHQQNCSAPVKTFALDDNPYGLGAHLYLWSQALCNAWQEGYRIQTRSSHWLWMDQAYCHDNFQCYFPKMEVCPRQETEVLVADPGNKKLRCSQMQREGFLQEFRSAAVEYIFQAVSPIVIQEAQRQASILFGNAIPSNLITVHVRWGDKFWEMDLPPIQEYIEGVQQILRKRQDNSSVHIYLATEDPKAAKEFTQAAPAHWKIYIDRTIAELNDYRPVKGNRASWTTRNTKGRAGLVALGSLLVGLEANDFVLTTKSNWSRLWNELRKMVLDPSCGNCTRVVDLRPGDW